MVGVRVEDRPALVPVDLTHAEEAGVAGLGDPSDAVGMEDGIPVLRDRRDPVEAAEDRVRADSCGEGDHDRHPGVCSGGPGRDRVARLGTPDAAHREQHGGEHQGGDAEDQRRPPDSECGRPRAGETGDRVREQRGGRCERPPAQPGGEPGEPSGDRERRQVEADQRDVGEPDLRRRHNTPPGPLGRAATDGINARSGPFARRAASTVGDRMRTRCAV